MTLIKFSNQMPAQKAGMIPDFNHFLSEIFENSITSDFRKWNSPAVNIVDFDDRFELQVAAPGLTKDDFKITIEGNRLSISVSKETDTKEKQGHYSRREFQFESFSRSFTMPDEVNLDTVKASYENGIMTLTLPKLKEEKVKSREIKLS